MPSTLGELLRPHSLIALTAPTIALLGRVVQVPCFVAPASPVLISTSTQPLQPAVPPLSVQSRPAGFLPFPSSTTIAPC
jgi:hypothetical protein